jgi:hypothetical protein
VQDNLVVIEGIIPPEAGGWTIREVGIKDAAGDLILLGNYPATEKPAPESGGEKQIIVRGGMRISNGGDTVLQIDSSLVMATEEYVNSRAPHYVRAVSPNNIVLAGLQTIDGVTLAANDLVLVAAQNTAAANGIYKVAAGAWSRSFDANTDFEVLAGMVVIVQEGVVNFDTVWLLSTNAPITLGTTELTFTKIFPDERSRSIVDNAAPTGDDASPTSLFSWLAYMVKAITGKANWRTAPATTLQAAAYHIAATTPHSGHAPLASPALTGTPTAPTAVAGTNTIQLATTAFVIAATPAASEMVSGKVELATAAETTAGVDNTRAVHPAGLKVELDKKAPLDSPTLTGTPLAPTAAPGTNTQQLATTEFVKAASPASLASSGYQKLPSGFILQWGKTNIVALDAVVDLTFPIAFPNACRLAVTGNINSNEGNDETGSRVISTSNTQVRVKCEGFGASIGDHIVTYIAIGL